MPLGVHMALSLRSQNAAVGEESLTMILPAGISGFVSCLMTIVGRNEFVAWYVHCTGINFILWYVPGTSSLRGTYELIRTIYLMVRINSWPFKMRHDSQARQAPPNSRPFENG